MTRIKTALMAGVAIAACSATTESANAQIYSGGSTLASKVYRLLFDCFAVPVSPEFNGWPAIGISTACGNFTLYYGDVSGTTLQMLYAPVGSGAGKRAFLNHDGSTTTTTGLGTPSSTNSIPYTSGLLPGYGYPKFHFAGSDDVITQTDIDLYSRTSGPANFGNIIQIPAFVTAIPIAFNGKDGTGAALNINGVKWYMIWGYNGWQWVDILGTSRLNLSRQALCGIFSGHITQWNNPILTALNGGTTLGTGNITVVHRQDGDGTTFILTSALIAQCAGVTGPNNEADSSTVLYSFRFSDRTVPTAQCPANLTVQAAASINWPDLVTNQCPTSNTIANPGGGHFAGASGDAGMVSTITATNGAIGYASPDFIQPIVPTGLAAANLESQYDIDNATGGFQAPTAYGAAAAMSEVNPVFNVAGAQNPINWSRQGVVPNPLLQGAYPISGFTWLNFYQCYKRTDGTYPFLLSYLQFHYGPTAQAILATQAFAPIPEAWLNFVGYILTDPATGMNQSGEPGTGCATKNGA